MLLDRTNSRQRGPRFPAAQFARVLAYLRAEATNGDLPPPPFVASPSLPAPPARAGDRHGRIPRDPASAGQPAARPRRRRRGVLPPGAGLRALARGLRGRA